MKMLRSLLSIACLCSSMVCAGNNLVVYQIPAFYNFQKEYPLDSDPERRLRINPVPISTAEYDGLLQLPDENPQVSIRALKGETIYKSFLIENLASPETITARLESMPGGSKFTTSNTEVSLVATWFQSGIYTTFTEGRQWLTHELLLKSDVDVSFKDGWEKRGIKWYYLPPTLPEGEVVTSFIPSNDTRRLLVEINVPESILAGQYKLGLIISSGNSEGEPRVIQLDIDVVDVKLDIKLKDQKSLFIFTGLALDPQVGRPNTYINGQNNLGDSAYQEKVYRNMVQDINDKGFNGVFINDWREPYAREALSLIDEAGLLDVVFCGKCPVNAGEKIVNQSLVDLIEVSGYKPIFYGYDEPGGNSKLQEQIALNQEIHELGAASINALFWEDFPQVKEAASNPGSQFEYITISMGSHGNKEFLNTLPMEGGLGRVKYLAYWHPNVENPTRNKLFMGYWLWASGLDGVSPHTYLMLPHIAKYVTAAPAEERGRLSSFNDFSMWDNPVGIFRQHATVYPKNGGVISTLQWEAIADGVTDLVLVQQLEELVAVSHNESLNMRASALIEEIKSKAMVRNSSALSRAQISDFMFLMDSWKKQIQQLIVEYSLSGIYSVSAPEAPIFESAIVDQ